MMGVKTTAKRDAQIRSARRGGLSLSEVGERFGISKQAVHMILRRDGETMPPDRRWGVTAEALCAGCGKLIRMSAALLRTRRKRSLSGNTYCSRQCSSAANGGLGTRRRKLADADILRAIELRTTTALPWAAIAATFGVSTMTVQRRVWQHLLATGQPAEGIRGGKRGRYPKRY